jgi:hypothetical protein
LSCYTPDSDFVRQQPGQLWFEFLPAYAPELNPVEFVIALETARVTQLLPHNSRTAEPSLAHAFSRMRNRPTLVIAFWQQAGLLPM